VKLLFATTNAGKLKELRLLVAGSPLEVVSLAELPPLPEVEEDGATFADNAAKKARAYRDATGLAALADDSGLCVDALDGRPGVHSARYAPDDASRIARLLRELSSVSVEARGAHFECALALALPGGELVLERGRCEGRITAAPRGAHGFGYDPVFEAQGGKTLAELTAEEKSALSHRGRAFAAMRPHLLACATRSDGRR
jgi:XTP/dITP diphosphohydrolase